MSGQTTVLGIDSPGVVTNLHLKAPRLIIGSMARTMPSRNSGPWPGGP